MSVMHVQAANPSPLCCLASCMVFQILAVPATHVLLTDELLIPHGRHGRASSCAPHQRQSRRPPRKQMQLHGLVFAGTHSRQ